MTSDRTNTARDYADQASATASKLKPGGYDSVKALALLSIAHSLVTLAENSEQSDSTK
jgi:hypothetical protein